MASSFPDCWTRLVDDAAIFPPGNSPVPEAVSAHLSHRQEWWADLVGPFVVSEERIADVDRPLAVAVVVSGGAGAVPGAVRLVERRGHTLAGLEVALRDLDDLAGNARRVAAAVDAARAGGLLDEDVPTYVELPGTPDSRSWQAAADVVAESALRLKFRTGGLEADRFPTPATLAGWIDAALDRETPFKCTAGLHHAVARADEPGFGRPVHRHGFLNVLLATLHAFDGASSDDVARTLAECDPDVLTGAATETDLTRARRWFTSFGSCSVREPLDDLLTLGLLETP